MIFFIGVYIKNIIFIQFKKLYSLRDCDVFLK